MLQDPVNDALRQMAERIRWMESRFGYFEGVQFSAADAAALLLYPTPQSIPNNAWTEVDFNFASGGTWPLGLPIEDGHALGDNIDKVKATLIPAEHILLFTMEPEFASNATGLRGCRWIASDGSARTELHAAVNGDVTAFSMIHWRRQIIASTYYHCQVYQNSGAPLNLTFFDFGAFRFR
jgi:hypothetical protein